MREAPVDLWTVESSDAELLAGVRAGESAAFGVLFERHAAAARRVASMYSAVPSDVDDIVSESFARVLKILQEGGGPDLAFRAYLFTVVRRTGLDLIRKAKRIAPDDVADCDAKIGYSASSDEPTLTDFEHSVVADAFKSLPERWQVVLWYTEIEKKAPAEVAPLLGLSPNGVAALAYRAREALRQAYLQQHLATTEDVSCLAVSEHLSAYVRGGLTKREHAKVEAHIKQCSRCEPLVAELEDVNRGLRSIVAPLVLGLIGLGALETSLPIGGVGATSVTAGAGAGGAGSAGAGSAGAGSAGSGGATAVASGGVTTGVASGVAGVAISATGAATSSSLLSQATSAVTTVMANTVSAGTTILTTTVATLGVAALAVAGAGLIGGLSEYHDNEADGNDSSTSIVDLVMSGKDGIPAHELPPVSDIFIPSVDPVPATPDSPGSQASGPRVASSGGTDPDPTVVEPDVDLSVSVGAVGFIELALNSPTVPVRVRNAGSYDSTAVTVTVTLPGGISFTPGLATIGDWTCDSSVNVAICTVDSVAAGSKVTLNLGVSAISALPSGAVTTVAFSDETGFSSSMSVATGLSPEARDAGLLYAAEGHLGTTISGGQILSCDPTDNDCQKALHFNGNAVKNENNNNAWEMSEVNSAGGNTNSASSLLTISQDANVLVAYVVWSANRGPSDGFTGDPSQTRIKPPGAAGYIDIIADNVDTWTDPGNRVYYQARADVTSLVQQYGGGSWALADISVSNGRTDTDPSYYAGFALTTVFEQAALPESNVAIYGGLDPVTKEDDAEYTFATTSESDVKVSVITWEGDRGIDGDSLTLDGDKMTPQHTSSGGAISTGDVDNAFDSTAFGSGVANTMGTDAKEFKDETVDAGVHNLVAQTDGDNLAVSMVIIQTTPTD